MIHSETSISCICCAAYEHLLSAIEAFAESQVSLCSQILRNLPTIWIRSYFYVGCMLKTKKNIKPQLKYSIMDNLKINIGRIWEFIIRNKKIFHKQDSILHYMIEAVGRFCSRCEHNVSCSLQTLLSQGAGHNRWRSRCKKSTWRNQ